MNIPKGNKLISELSGGEQRIVSLAIALLNDSKLIILDEPTVGMDMIITSNIWKYLLKRCEQESIILFVTQYVEEATHANQVAFIRKGRLLVEQKPSVLMQKFNEVSLENIFLKLCIIDKKSDTTNINEETTESKQSYLTSHQSQDRKFENTSKERDWGTIFCILVILIRRNLLKIMQIDYPSILLFLLPAIQTLIFCLMFCKDLVYVRIS